LIDRSNGGHHHGDQEEKEEEEERSEAELNLPPARCRQDFLHGPKGLMHRGGSAAIARKPRAGDSPAFLYAGADVPTRPRRRTRIAIDYVAIDRIAAHHPWRFITPGTNS
jgi:hypothetical protein